MFLCLSPCRFEDRHQRFGSAYRFHLQSWNLHGSQNSEEHRHPRHCYQISQSKTLFVGARRGFTTYCGTHPIWSQSRHTFIDTHYTVRDPLRVVAECPSSGTVLEGTARQNPWCGNECRRGYATQGKGRNWIQVKRVPHWAPTNKHLIIGSLFWNSSFSNMWPE